MNLILTEAFIAQPAIGNIPDGGPSGYVGDAAQKWVLGQVCLAQDVGAPTGPSAAAAKGGVEVIYLPSVANNAYGLVLIYDQNAKTVKLGVQGDRGPCVVSLGAIPAANFAWYIISGIAVVKDAGAIVAGSPIYWTAATAGQVTQAVNATDKIDSMRAKSADGVPAAGYAYVELDRPSASGNG